MIGLSSTWRCWSARFVTLLGARRRRVAGARPLVAACFVAMLVDSFGYTGFTTDPATWALLGLGIACAVGPPEPPAATQL